MCRLHLTVGHNKSISVEIKSVVVSLSKACVKMSHTLTLAIIYSSEEALTPPTIIYLIAVCQNTARKLICEEIR